MRNAAELLADGRQLVIDSLQFVCAGHPAEVWKLRATEWLANLNEHQKAATAPTDPDLPALDSLAAMKARKGGG